MVMLEANQVAVKALQRGGRPRRVLLACWLLWLTAGAALVVTAYVFPWLGKDKSSPNFTVISFVLSLAVAIPALVLAVGLLRGHRWAHLLALGAFATVTITGAALVWEDVDRMYFQEDGPWPEASHDLDLSIPVLGYGLVGISLLSGRAAWDWFWRRR